MDDGRPLDERVDALERAVTDGHASDGLPDVARTAARVDDLETTVEGIDDRVAELEATVQALRGFAGGVRAVDETIERRADAAIARVDRLEAELDELREQTGDDGRVTGPGTDSNGRSVTEDRGDVGGADSERPTARRDRDAENARATSGGLGVGTDRDDSLATEVAARSDAALAEAAAMTDRSRDESDDEASLADRIRRLL